MINEGEYSQEKLYGGRGGTSSKTWIGSGENEAIPEKGNYMSKNSDKVEPVTTHSSQALPQEMLAGKMEKETGRISMHVDDK